MVLAALLIVAGWVKPLADALITDWHGAWGVECASSLLTPHDVAILLTSYSYPPLHLHTLMVPSTEHVSKHGSVGCVATPHITPWCAWKLDTRLASTRSQ
eukprot:GHUV01026733.1.p3 GENE.GHUV01026733.1~~GHUV01026733.1.p3  ORF type:complete len:100 (-),score=17.51 GHUV01026733.1:729-1028(-)